MLPPLHQLSIGGRVYRKRDREDGIEEEATETLTEGSCQLQATARLHSGLKRMDFKVIDIVGRKEVFKLYEVPLPQGRQTTSLNLQTKYDGDNLADIDNDPWGDKAEQCKYTMYYGIKVVVAATRKLLKNLQSMQYTDRVIFDYLDKDHSAEEHAEWLNPKDANDILRLIQRTQWRFAYYERLGFTFVPSVAAKQAIHTAEGRMKWWRELSEELWELWQSNRDKYIETVQDTRPIDDAGTTLLGPPPELEGRMVKGFAEEFTGDLVKLAERGPPTKEG